MFPGRPDGPEKYINEKKLIEQLKEFIEAKAETIEINADLEAKCRKHMSLVSSVLEDRGIEPSDTSALIEYSKYVLSKETYKQQGNLVDGIQNTFKIRNQSLHVS